MMFEYNTVYPEERWVSEDTIRMWYADASSNDEVDCTDLTDIDLIMDELMSAGFVTFTTKTRYHE
jgi:hypothetical protein